MGLVLWQSIKLRSKRIFKEHVRAERKQKLEELIMAHPQEVPRIEIHEQEGL